MTIATVPLTDTFDQWRIKFNSVVAVQNAQISPEALADLTTTATSSLVDAINELNANKADTSVPTTFTESTTFNDNIIMDGGNVLLDTGTAGAPSLTFDGDPDTGVFHSGANEFAITTNGATALIAKATETKFVKDIRMEAGLNIALDGNFTITNSLSTVILDQDGVALSPGSVQNADIGDEEIENTKLNIRQAADQLGVSGAISVNYALGDWFHIQPSGAITLSFTNFPTQVGGVVIEAEDFGAVAVTWPAGTRFSGGAAPTFTSSGTDLLSVIKDVSGVFYVQVIDQDYQSI